MIFWLNLTFISFIALNINFSFSAYIFYLIPLILYLPSNIYFVLYSQKKIGKYAIIGFSLGLIAQCLSLWFYFGLLFSTIIYSYIIPSFIMYITIILICSIIIALYLTSLIFRHRNKITPASDIKIKLPHLPKFPLKLLIIIGILLFIGFSIIPYIIIYNTRIYLVRADKGFALLFFDQLLFAYFYLFDYYPVEQLNLQLTQLSNLFSFIGLIGIILIIFSIIIKLITYSKSNKID